MGMVLTDKKYNLPERSGHCVDVSFDWEAIYEETWAGG
jgi:hypothetical protein